MSLEVYIILHSLKYTLPTLMEKNVEEYLEWETKFDQTFKKYKVDEHTRFFLATLCFQEYARSWWQQRQLDVRIGTTSNV